MVTIWVRMIALARKAVHCDTRKIGSSTSLQVVNTRATNPTVAMTHVPTASWPVWPFVKLV